MADQHGREVIGWSVESDQAAIIGHVLTGIAHRYRAPKGDKLSAGNAEVLFIFIRPGRGAVTACIPSPPRSLYD